MPLQVVNNALLQCTFGAAPSALGVLPANMVNCGNQPAANIMDHKPMVNIKPFAMCMSLANPQVAAATSAALGVLTPMPCVPMTQTPWAPGAAQTMVANMPALHDGCMCNCMWAGVIKVSFAGQVQTQVS